MPKAAAPFCSRPGTFCRTHSSRSCGKKLRPLRMIISLHLPETKRCPPDMKPMSPVRRKGPSPDPASTACRTVFVASGCSQYPGETHVPLIQISPRSFSSTSRHVWGSTMRTSLLRPAVPQESSGMASACCSCRKRMRPAAYSCLSRKTAKSPSFFQQPVVNSVFSARP